MSYFCDNLFPCDLFYKHGVSESICVIIMIYFCRIWRNTITITGLPFHVCVLKKISLLSKNQRSLTHYLSQHRYSLESLSLSLNRNTRVFLFLFAIALTFQMETWWVSQNWLIFKWTSSIKRLLSLKKITGSLWKWMLLFEGNPIRKSNRIWPVLKGTMWEKDK